MHRSPGEVRSPETGDIRRDLSMRSSPAPNWPGGYFCPCHGSKYDLAGRVYTAVPAPYNLPVPPYHFVNQHTLRIGENPPGVKFELASVVQM
jgi:ubiquinol-cytochrome c reductase iron-sulfur subunit